jgi:CheY-like chemotaxis protein
MAAVFRVALLGFSAFERSTLHSYFRLASTRQPHYELVQLLPDADFIVADADHEASVHLVKAVERMPEAVFVGGRAPEGAIAALPRPIDPMRVLRELDVMAARAAPREPPPVLQGSQRRTVIQPVRPRRPEPPQDLLQAATGEGPAVDLDLPVEPPTAEPRALLVDDSEVALQFLRKKLAAYGLQTDCVQHSDAALERLAAQRYDFVFLDLELGEGSALDGLGLCAHIKQRREAAHGVAARVVMVSAHRTELDRVRCSLAGCDGFLGKPLDEVELAACLGRHGLKPPASRDPSLGS